MVLDGVLEVASEGAEVQGVGLYSMGIGLVGRVYRVGSGEEERGCLKGMVGLEGEEEGGGIDCVSGSLSDTSRAQGRPADALLASCRLGGMLKGCSRCQKGFNKYEALSI